MQINSLTSSPFQATGSSNPFAKIKQSFEKLGSALDSGNLSDAKKALAQLQQNAPAQAGAANNPLSKKIETLSKAVDSGDLKGAQDAYADVKKTMTRRPAAGADRAGGPPAGAPPAGGAPSGGAADNSAKILSSVGDTSSSNKSYDKQDANKDGKVSWKEEQDYKLEHPDEAQTTSDTPKIDSDRGLITAAT